MSLQKCDMLDKKTNFIYFKLWWRQRHGEEGGGREEGGVGREGMVGGFSPWTGLL